MASQDYLLRFDLTEVNRQLSSVQQSYTEFGAAIRQVSAGVIEDMRGMKEELTALSLTLTQASMSFETTYQTMFQNADNIVKLLEGMSDESKKIADNFKELHKVDLPLAAGAPGMLPPGKDTAQERIEDIAPGGVEGLVGDQETEEVGALQEIVQQAVEDAHTALEEAEKAKKEAEESKSALDKAIKGVKDTINREVKGTEKALGGIASQAPGIGGFATGFLGGLIGMMVLGASEKQRVQKEYGEMLNVFEVTGENFFEGASKKAMGWFARFAEHAQFKFGISRQESQAVVRAFVDAGMMSTDVIDDVKKKITDVTANVATLTLGVDKHLNLASGTSAQNVVQMVATYGDGLEEAGQKFTKFAFAAQRSGIGVNKFIDSVNSGSQAIAQYGIDLEDVAGTLSKIQKHYEEMGLEKQFAGTQATGALAGITQGISGMSDAMQVIIAQRMFPGMGGMEARQQLMEGWQRVASGEDTDFFRQMMQHLSGFALQQTGGNRVESIEFLRKQGLPHQAATTLIDMKLSGKLEEANKLSELNKKELRNLKNAFKTEGDRLSQMEKNTRDLINSVADIGQGLIKTVAGLVGAIVVGFKSIPAAIKAFASFDMQALTELSDMNQRQLDNIGEGLSQVWGGMKGLGKAGINIADDVGFGDVIDAVQFGQFVEDVTEFVSDTNTRMAFLEEVYLGMIEDNGLLSMVTSLNDSWEEQRKQYAEQMQKNIHAVRKKRYADREKKKMGQGTFVNRGDWRNTKQIIYADDLTDAQKKAALKKVEAEGDG